MKLAQQHDHIVSMVAKGMSFAAIARELFTSDDSVTLYCKKYNIVKPKINSIRYCRNCNTELTNKQQKLFCSTSCSAIWNNKAYPKRRKQEVKVTCKNCGSLVRWIDGHARCNTCYLSNRVTNKTLRQMMGQSGFHSSIRSDARRVFFESIKNEQPVCARCGYSKHIEVCHVKAIKDFDLDTLIKDINSPDNLLGLCPNCHWEHDHNLLN